MTKSTFSKQDDAIITKMRAQNIKFGIIAARLGRSRNSVIGRANRIGVQKPDRQRFAKKVEAENRKPTRPILLRPKLAPKGRQCQWIEGDPSPDDSCKCRAWTVEGKPYCQAHLDRAYRRDGYIPVGYRVSA